METSPKRNWKGFKITKNFKDALKKAIYSLVPAIITLLVANSIVTAGIAGLIGPMLLNAMEFFFKEVELKK